MSDEDAMKSKLIESGKGGKSFQEACNICGVNEIQAAKYWPVVTAYHEGKLAEFLYEWHYKYVIQGRLVFVALDARPQDTQDGWKDIAKEVMRFKREGRI